MANNREEIEQHSTTQQRQSMDTAKPKQKVQKKVNNAKKRVKNTARTVKKKVEELDSEKVKEILLKEEMSKKHKYILFFLSSIVLAFLIYIGVSFALQNMTTAKPVLEEIELGTYEKMSKSPGKSVVYIATKNSEMNKEYEDILIEVVQGRKTRVHFLDLGLIKERHQTIGFMNTIDLTKDTYTEPMILIFEDGAVKANLQGTSTKKELIAFLDKNRVD